jgi:hypothetical protein
MNRKIKVRVSWRKGEPLKMAGVARGIVTPEIPLLDLEKGATRVENAWANRKNGPVAKDELKNSSIALDDNLVIQADYVSKIANGSSTLIHSAGFESTEDVVMARVMVQEDPEAPVCTPLSGGAIKVTVNGKSRISNYCFILVVDGVLNISIQNGQLLIPTGSTNTYIINGTKHIVTFKGLATLKSVQVAVVYVNAAGASGISPIATSSTIV